MSESPNPIPAETGKDYQVLYMTACEILGVSEEGFENALKENTELAAEAKRLGERKLAAQTAKADKETAVDAAKKAKADRVTERNAEKLRRWKRAAPLRMVSGGVRMVLWNILAALSPILLVGGGILIIVFVLPLILEHALQEAAIKRLQAQVEAKTAEITGLHKEMEDGKSAWASIEANLQTQLGGVRQELSQERVRVEDLNRLMRTAREAVRQHGGTLGEDAALAEGIDQLARRLKTEAERWRTDSEQNRDLCVEKAILLCTRNTELLKTLGLTVTSWRVASGRSGYERYFTPESAQRLVVTINTLLGKICDEMETETGFAEGVPRPWQQARMEDGALCKDVLKQAISAMRQNNVSLDNLDRLRRCGLVD